MCSGISGRGDNEGHVRDNMYKVTLLCVQESLDEVTVGDTMHKVTLLYVQESLDEVTVKDMLVTTCIR